MKKTYAPAKPPVTPISSFRNLILYFHELRGVITVPLFPYMVSSGSLFFYEVQ